MTTTPPCSAADAGAPHFDRLYHQDADPWRVATSWYECRKRELVLAALPRPRYAAAFEAGCGQGELTLALARRCAKVWAADFSAVALERLKVRLDGESGQRISLLRMQIPEQLHAWSGRPGPLDAPDLVLVSELAYYLGAGRLQSLLDCLGQAMADGGDLVFCHSRQAFGDRQQDTDAIHGQVGAQPWLDGLGGWREADFEIRVWRKAARASPGGPAHASSPAAPLP